MKICILSMQRVGNFGSLLQSYALKKILFWMIRRKMVLPCCVLLAMQNSMGTSSFLRIVSEELWKQKIAM